MNRWRRLLAGLREFSTTQLELHERLQLLNRPWEEYLTHWAHDGYTWQLHGHLPPPADGHRRSVTPGGWCPGRRRCPNDFNDQPARGITTDRNDQSGQP